MYDCESKLHLLDTPYIITQGGIDKLVNPSGAYDLMKKSKTVKKVLLFYPKVWHNICLDPKWEKVMDDVVKMIPEFLNEKEKE